MAGCINDCYVNSCTSNVAPNTVWSYALFPANNSSVIHDETYTSIQESITSERVRRSLSVFSFDTPRGSDEYSPAGGTLIYGDNASVQEQMKDIKDAINGISYEYVTYRVYDGSPLTYISLVEAKTKLDYLRAQCICHSDCGGHLVCACHGDCCDYSDERLKRDIRSL